MLGVHLCSLVYFFSCKIQVFPGLLWRKPGSSSTGLKEQLQEFQLDCQRRERCAARAKHVRLLILSHLFFFFFQKMFLLFPHYSCSDLHDLNTATDQVLYSAGLWTSWSDSCFEVCQKDFGGFSLQGYKAIVHDNSLETDWSPRLYCNSAQGGFEISHPIFATLFLSTLSL